MSAKGKTKLVISVRQVRLGYDQIQYHSVLYLLVVLGYAFVNTRKNNDVGGHAAAGPYELRLMTWGSGMTLKGQILRFM